MVTSSFGTLEGSLNVFLNACVDCWNSFKSHTCLTLYSSTTYMQQFTTKYVPFPFPVFTIFLSWKSHRELFRICLLKLSHGGLDGNRLCHWWDWTGSRQFSYLWTKATELKPLKWFHSCKQERLMRISESICTCISMVCLRKIRMRARSTMACRFIFNCFVVWCLHPTLFQLVLTGRRGAC